MSLGSVVFFEHQIVASPFEKNFHKVCCVRVVIDNQDAPSFFHSRTAGWTSPGKISVGSLRKKVCFDYLVHTFSITFLAGCLDRQPGDDPGAAEPDHYSNIFSPVGFRLVAPPVDPFSEKKVRATQQAAIHRSRTWDNHRSRRPTQDARRAKRRLFVAEVGDKSGSCR